MRVQQARDLDGHFLAAARRARNQRRLGNVRRHRDAHAAKELNPLGDEIDDLDLLVVMLVEQQMQLVEGRAGDLPVVFLVHVAQRHRVREQLIEVRHALEARALFERDRQLHEMAERLDLVRGLMDQRPGSAQPVHHVGRLVGPHVPFLAALGWLH